MKSFWQTVQKSGVRIADVAVFLFLLLASGFLFFVLRDKSLGDLYCNIETPFASYMYPLDDNGIYSVQGKTGGLDVQIKDGYVRIVNSSCIGKDCMANSISMSGQSLICLPNRVIVSVTGRREVDEVSY